MVGAKVYDRFVALVHERDRLRTQGVPLPHPAVRGLRSPAPAPATSAVGSDAGAASDGRAAAEGDSI
jgi:hypothetical protein